MILAIAVALIVAACGSTSTSSPVASTLSYFPKDSPFVMSAVTDPSSRAIKQAQAMLARIPFANFGLAAVISRLQQVGIDYDTDIRPLFGSPGWAGRAERNRQREGQAARRWVTNDATTLASLVKKLHVTPSGSHDGATLYQALGLTVAVDGATLVGESSHSQLGSLSRDALITAAGNLGPTLSASPRTAKARTVPCAAALQGYGVAVSAGSGGLTIRYTLKTTGGSLSSSELPIAPGTSPPGLAGNMPIQVGLREPAATLNFLLDVERRTDSARYASDMSKMAAVERKTGVDFQRDVLGQIGSNAAIESTGNGAIVGVDVINPAAAQRTLRKLGASALDLFGQHPGTRVTRGPDGFYAAHSAGGKTVLFGLVGSEFVGQRHGRPAASLRQRAGGRRPRGSGRGRVQDRAAAAAPAHAADRTTGDGPAGPELAERNHRMALVER